MEVPACGGGRSGGGGGGGSGGGGSGGGGGGGGGSGARTRDTGNPYHHVAVAARLGDLHKLVVVVVPVEEGLLTEDHAREHAPERPHIQRVVVVLEVHEQLGALEVARRDAHVVLAAGHVELG